MACRPCSCTRRDMPDWNSLPATASCRAAWNWAARSRSRTIPCWRWRKRRPDMHKFRLDFHRAPPPSLGGWLLAAVGLAAVAVTGWVQYDESLARQAQATRLARLQASDSAALAADKPDDPALAAARQALQRAQLPWRNLFG